MRKGTKQEEPQAVVELRRRTLSSAGLATDDVCGMWRRSLHLPVLSHCPKSCGSSKGVSCCKLPTVLVATSPLKRKPHPVLTIATVI